MVILYNDLLSYVNIGRFERRAYTKEIELTGANSLSTIDPLKLVDKIEEGSSLKLATAHILRRL